MQKKVLKYLQNNKKGITLVEVTIAMLLITTILLGGIQFFSGGNKLLQVAKLRRLAAIELNERAEFIRQLPYVNISNNLIENNVPIKIGNLTFYRTTIVNNIDDPLDGTGSGDKDNNPLDYKLVTIIIRWNPGANNYYKATLLIAQDYQP